MSNTFSSICDSIYRIFESNSLESDFVPFIDEILTQLTMIKHTGDWNSSMNSISRILNAPTTFVGSDNCPQEFKLFKLIESIRSKHFHQNVSTDGIHVAIPSKKKVQTISCDFHKESLFEHSILAMVVSLNHAFHAKNVNPILAGLTGLFHDVGKPACLTQYSMNLGYPFHGEYGSCILSQFFSPQIEEHLTRVEYEQMLRAIGVHMCSYHTTTDDEWSTYRRTLAQLEKDEVKNLLHCLSFGDTFGKVSSFNDKSAFLASRESYNKIVSTPFDVKKFMESNKFNVPCIFVRGMSGSGKTHFIQNMLIPYLSRYFETSQFSVISRDEIMASITAQRIAHTLSQPRPIGEEYRKLYNAYKLRKLGKAVNDEMRKVISSLISEGRIPIIDSCILYYGGIEGCMPDNINRSFIISVDCTRNTIYTESDSEKNGMTMSDTLTMLASRTPLTCLPSAINLTELSAITTHSKKPDTKWIPQLSFSVGFNSSSSVGFDNFAEVVHPIMTYFSGILESSDTDSMNITQYVNFLYKKFGYDGMRAAFSEQFYLAADSHRNKRILRLKYLDCNNRWRSAWNRHTRGTTFYLNDSDEWVPIKYLLQRGCEMMTGIQVSHGIDSTESFNLDGASLDEKISSAISSTLIFDDVQRKTILSLLMNREIDGNLTLSFKKDGSLLGFTICRDPVIQQFLRDFINSTDDEFAKKILKMCDALSLPLCYFSSQATLLIGSDMLDWTVQALLSVIMTDDEIVTNYSGRSYMEAVDEKFPEILIKLNSVCIDASAKLAFPATSTITVSMESICKNRRSIFGKKDHTELALSYSSSSCTVLGISMCDISSMKSIPHFAFSDIIKSNGFVEPCYWTVSHTSEVNSLLSDLNDVIFEKITPDEFFSKNHPHNLFCNWERIIDREGFVTYTGTHHDYGKIKTDAYYIAHKLREKNINYLMELAQIPSACASFPLCNEVNQFYSKLVENLTKINEVFNQMCENTSSPLYLGMPEKARISFQRQSPTIRLKMLINASDSFSNVAVDIFKTVYPFNTESIPDDLNAEIISVVKGILMGFVGNTISFENPSTSPLFGSLFCVVRKVMQTC